MLEFRIDSETKVFTDFTVQFLDNSLFDKHIFFFFSEEVTVIFSMNDSYDEFEKLILPFDFETWMLIILFFLSAFCVIILVNFFLSIEQQKFIFGTFVKTPSFNVVATFFGQGQNILPGRNFARYLLTMFVLFCLIKIL